MPSTQSLLELLETRRSVGTTLLTAPGPDDAQLQRILTIGARVPDHGVLEPWRFIVFTGTARLDVGAALSTVYRTEHPAMERARLEKFAGVMSRVFSYAPVVILVVSAPDANAKVAVREQEASAAAVCMNLLHAANAYGFGATWVTGWAADSRGAAAVYGLADHERITGIVHLGTASERPDDRRRPDLARIVQHWSKPGD